MFVKKDGFVYFVDNLLPGETANVKITKLNKKFGFGEVVEHIVKSEKRKSKEPLSFGNLFHLDNLSQLDYQTELTRDI